MLTRLFNRKQQAPLEAPPPAPRPAHWLSEHQEQAIEAALRRTYFSSWDPAYFDTPKGREDIDAIVKGRYYACVEKIVPWIQRRMPLAGKHIIEIGCGTGSSTSGIARVAGRVDAYDIDAGSIEAARLRAQALDQANVTFHVVQAQRLLSTVRERHTQGSVDAALLYAVLEHQHVHERLETLITCWQALRPGGLLVIVETPNRLVYPDAHTSLLPFYSMLPPDLAIKYAGRSPRPSFSESIAAAASISEGEAVERLARWGRGVSYHEFELALGDLRPLVVGDGHEPEILDLCPMTTAERCLATYWEAERIEAPRGFVRTDLYLILRKPDDVHRSS